MSNIENIHKVNNKIKMISNQYNEYLKEMVGQGELLLQKYFDDGINSDYDKVPKNIWIVKEKICADLNLKLIESDWMNLRYLIGKRYSNTKEQKKYTCHIPKSTYILEETCIVAFAVGIVIFNKFPLNCIVGDLNFEFPNNFSLNFELGELAFIYSLIIPYQQFKQHLIVFSEKNDKFADNNIWIEYLCCAAGCPRYMAAVISTFYSNLYYDELTEIWSNYIYKHEKILITQTNKSYTKKL